MEILCKDGTRRQESDGSPCVLFPFPLMYKEEANGYFGDGLWLNLAQRITSRATLFFWVLVELLIFVDRCPHSGSGIFPLNWANDCKQNHFIWGLFLKQFKIFRHGVLILVFLYQLSFGYFM